MQLLTAASIHFDMHLFLDRVIHPNGLFLKALVTTLYVSVAAQIIGVVLGVCSALGWRSRLLPARAAARVYVTLFRGTPLIVQIFFIYFGAGLFLGVDLFPQMTAIGPVHVSGAIVAGITALALNEGAYMSEIVRAGISSVDAGQLESARAVGMTQRLAMRRIILPQAARLIVPPLGNDFNVMMKNSSLLAFIGVYEMFDDAQVHYSVTFRPSEYFAAVAVWYLLLTLVWSAIQIVIERRLGAGYGAERGSGRFWSAHRWLRRGAVQEAR